MDTIMEKSLDLSFEFCNKELTLRMSYPQDGSVKVLRIPIAYKEREIMEDVFMEYLSDISVDICDYMLMWLDEYSDLTNI